MRPPRKREQPMSKWPRGEADIEDLLRRGELEQVTGARPTAARYSLRRRGLLRLRLG